MLEKRPLLLKPHSVKQEQALLAKTKILLCGTGIQWGKGLPLNGLVLTPNGYREAGSIAVGDILFDRNGKETKVIGVYRQGKMPCYRINLTDRKSFITDEEHLNIIKRRWKRKEAVIKTKDLFESKHLWGLARIPATKPIDLPEKDQYLDPYFIGAIIGDGSIVRSVGFSSADSEVIAKIAEVLPDGIQIKNKCGYDYEITEVIKKRTPEGYGYSRVTDYLRKIGLFGKKSYDKYIPDIYKYGSIDQRHKLLQGLMDTDGSISSESSKKIEFFTTSKQLAEDVVWLVESLGGKAWILEKKSFYTYKGEKKQGHPSYRVNIISPLYNPFYLPRKAEKYFVHENTADKIIKSVERVEDAETVCFSVDSETKSFIIGGQIVTHNTRIGSMRMKLKMHQYRDPNDSFIITAPTYKILNQSTLPAFLHIMDGYGRYNKQESAFHMHRGGTCYMRTNTEPDSIVGITNVRHIWGDEAGKYTLYFWENIQGRGSFKNCQIDLTTSPYTLNWIFKELIKPVSQGLRDDVTIIQAASIENPYFPAEEYYRREKTMDPRRFRMMYGGKWERMAGLVYDCWDDTKNKCAPFVLPQGTIFVGGIDWGYTDPFVVKVRAITPDNEHYNVHEFYKSQLTPSQIIDQCRSLDNIYGITRFYCDPSRPEMILELNRAGLRAVGADNNILYGIEKHYELIKTGRFKTFEGSSPYSDDEIETYHWPEPQDLKPDQDHKEPMPVDQNNHAMDADRYITIHTYKGIRDLLAVVPSDRPSSGEDQFKRIQRLKRNKPAWAREGFN